MRGLAGLEVGVAVAAAAAEVGDGAVQGDGSAVPAVPPATSSSSMGSSISTDAGVCIEEGFPAPAYRSARAAMASATEDAADEAEFDGVRVDEEGHAVTYRSVSAAVSPADAFGLDDDDEAAGPPPQLAALRGAVAALGALAEPGVLGSLPSDAAVEEQLALVTSAMRAVLVA